MTDTHIIRGAAIWLSIIVTCTTVFWGGLFAIVQIGRALL